jgi:hypothetical protein
MLGLLVVYIGWWVGSGMVVHMERGGIVEWRIRGWWNDRLLGRCFIEDHEMVGG